MNAPVAQPGQLTITKMIKCNLNNNKKRALQTELSQDAPVAGATVTAASATGLDRFKFNGSGGAGAVKSSTFMASTN